MVNVMRERGDTWQAPPLDRPTRLAWILSRDFATQIAPLLTYPSFAGGRTRRTFRADNLAFTMRTNPPLSFGKRFASQVRLYLYCLVILRGEVCRQDKFSIPA
jgi:hypothetical protein